jgi:hypothetical protein
MSPKRRERSEPDPGFGNPDLGGRGPDRAGEAPAAILSRNRPVGMRRVAPILGWGMLLGLASFARADELNDYPTVARADYVFGCMKANGETRQALERCSCSIDVIASILPYERYVTAETVLSMAQVPGALGTQFRSTEYAKVAVDDLRRAQAEAEVRCF